MSEEQGATLTLRSQWVSASERYIDHRWFKMKSKTYNGEVRSGEKDLKLYSWVPSLLQVCSSLKGPEV